MPTTPTCADELRKLYDAIMALSSGAKRQTVTFGERSVTYSQQNMRDLLALFRTFYGTCGADSGLVDLSEAMRGGAERGPPITLTRY